METKKHEMMMVGDMGGCSDLHGGESVGQSIDGKQGGDCIMSPPCCI